MRLFLSYSHADRRLAAELRKRLEAEGSTVSSFDEDPGTASGWHQALEEAIRAASAVLLLINDRVKVEDQQRVAWRLALEAVWAEPSKRLIPILLQDAELPAFVKSASSGGEVQAIRLRDPKDLDPVIQALAQTLGLSSRERTRTVERFEIRDSHGGSYDVIPDPGPSKQPRSIEFYPTVTDEDRARRAEDFAAIRRYAEHLKH